MREKGRVVLAYSGGLDTSVILHWLVKKGYEVIAYEANLGQQVESFKENEEKALKIGAKKYILKDLREEFITKFIFPAIWANACYEGGYLLGTALARPLIAQAQVKIAEEEGADFVAHGATGKGNDQIRFELAYARLNPSLKIIAPFKEEEFLKKFPGRGAEITYCQRHRIPLRVTAEKPYSSDENIAHISYEAGELEKIEQSPWEGPSSSSSSFKGMLKMCCLPEEAPDRPTYLQLSFRKGTPVEIKDETSQVEVRGALKLFQYANQIAGKNGCGITDLVENRFLGIKSRGIYEAPGHTLLLAAHRFLEQITLDREIMHQAEDNMPKFARLVYNGFWFSPEFQALKEWYRQIQKDVNGTVRVKLYKGNIFPLSREAGKYSLYRPLAASMMALGGEVNPLFARGFISSLAIREVANFEREKKVREKKL
jgi:argininosuccinate synthase